jgi:hypothetical protein
MESAQKIVISKPKGKRPWHRWENSIGLKEAEWEGETGFISLRIACSGGLL